MQGSRESKSSIFASHRSKSHPKLNDLSQINTDHACKGVISQARPSPLHKIMGSRECPTCEVKVTRLKEEKKTNFVTSNEDQTSFARSRTKDLKSEGAVHQREVYFPPQPNSTDFTPSKEANVYWSFISEGPLRQSVVEEIGNESGILVPRLHTGNSVKERLLRLSFQKSLKISLKKSIEEESISGQAKPKNNLKSILKSQSLPQPHSQPHSKPKQRPNARTQSENQPFASTIRIFCRNHPEEEGIFYCPDGQEILCSLCLLNDPKYLQGKSLQPLKRSYMDILQDIEELLTDVEGKRKILINRKKEFGLIREQWTLKANAVVRQIGTIISSIMNSFEKIRISAEKNVQRVLNDIETRIFLSEKEAEKKINYFDFVLNSMSKLRAQPTFSLEESFFQFFSQNRSEISSAVNIEGLQTSSGVEVSLAPKIFAGVFETLRKETLEMVSETIASISGIDQLEFSKEKKTSQLFSYKDLNFETIDSLLPSRNKSLFFKPQLSEIELNLKKTLKSPFFDHKKSCFLRSADPHPSQAFKLCQKDDQNLNGFCQSSLRPARKPRNSPTFLNALKVFDLRNSKKAANFQNLLAKSTFPIEKVLKFRRGTDEARIPDAIFCRFAESPA